MTRRVDPTRLIVGAGLILALTGCATRGTPGAGADATGTGGDATSSSALAQAGAATSGSSLGAQEGGVVRAPGAALFPTLPSPQDFKEAPGLRDIHFDFDRTTLRPEDARIVDANARWLLANPGTLVLIEGHADERGTNEYNLALGENRARVTRDQLVARGVSLSRITLVSYGEERPVCQQTNEACWAQNRRAHFLVKSPMTVGALQQ
jgi:peptidoglycan-associated lipoprotein